MNIAGLSLGLVASVMMVLGLIPCFGAINWLVIPLAVIGIVLSGVGLSQSPSGQKGAATAGLVLSIVAATFGAVRLFWARAWCELYIFKK
jgi:hypothetical protein